MSELHYLHIKWSDNPSEISHLFLLVFGGGQKKHPEMIGRRNKRQKQAFADLTSYCCLNCTTFLKYGKTRWYLLNLGLLRKGGWVEDGRNGLKTQQ